MGKVYHIKETKQVVYTYKVFAKSKREALDKFIHHQGYIEVGLDAGPGHTKTTIKAMGKAQDTCAECQLTYSPEDVGDFMCSKCR